MRPSQLIEEKMRQIQTGYKIEEISGSGFPAPDIISQSYEEKGVMKKPLIRDPYQDYYAEKRDNSSQIMAMAPYQYPQSSVGVIQRSGIAPEIDLITDSSLGKPPLYFPAKENAYSNIKIPSDQVLKMALPFAKPAELSERDRRIMQKELERQKKMTPLGTKPGGNQLLSAGAVIVQANSRFPVNENENKSNLAPYRSPSLPIAALERGKETYPLSYEVERGYSYLQEPSLKPRGSNLPPAEKKVSSLGSHPYPDKELASREREKEFLHNDYKQYELEAQNKYLKKESPYKQEMGFQIGGEGSVSDKRMKQQKYREELESQVKSKQNPIMKKTEYSNDIDAERKPKGESMSYFPAVHGTSSRQSTRTTPGFNEGYKEVYMPVVESEAEIGRKKKEAYARDLSAQIALKQQLNEPKPQAKRISIANPAPVSSNDQPIPHPSLANPKYARSESNNFSQLDKKAQQEYMKGELKKQIEEKEKIKLMEKQRDEKEMRKYAPSMPEEGKSSDSKSKAVTTERLKHEVKVSLPEPERGVETDPFVVGIQTHPYSFVQAPSPISDQIPKSPEVRTSQLLGSGSNIGVKETAIIGMKEAIEKSSINNIVSQPVRKEMQTTNANIADPAYVDMLSKYQTEIEELKAEKEKAQIEALAYKEQVEKERKMHAEMKNTQPVLESIESHPSEKLPTPTDKTIVQKPQSTQEQQINKSPKVTFEKSLTSETKLVAPAALEKVKTDDSKGWKLNLIGDAEKLADLQQVDLDEFAAQAYSESTLPIVRNKLPEEVPIHIASQHDNDRCRQSDNMKETPPTDMAISSALDQILEPCTDPEYVPATVIESVIPSEHVIQEPNSPLPDRIKENILPDPPKYHPNPAAGRKLHAEDEEIKGSNAGPINFDEIAAIGPPAETKNLEASKVVKKVKQVPSKKGAKKGKNQPIKQTHNALRKIEKAENPTPEVIDREEKKEETDEGSKDSVPIKKVRLKKGRVFGENIPEMGKMLEEVQKCIEEASKAINIPSSKVPSHQKNHPEQATADSDEKK